MKTTKTLSLMLSLLALTPLVACDEYWDDGYHTSTYTYTETETEYYEEYEEEVYYDDSADDMEVWPDYEKGSSRSFFGAYALDYSDSSCDNSSYYDADIDLPADIDVYEYGTMMDFENGYGDLVWNAEVSSWYEFSFLTHIYDWYDDPSIEFPCDCGFVNVGEYDEYIECACDPSTTGETCWMYYDLI